MIPFLLAALVGQPALPAEFRRPLPEQRAAMVAKIRAGVRTAAADADTPAFERGLTVIAKLPREDFVTAQGRAFAYMDTPQAIGFGQTISDPYIVAVMTAALDLPTDGSANVLDIGTGSGYQAAVLSPLARGVVSIEIVRPLADQARARLARMGYRNVTVIAGDGFAGAPDHAPFDGIIVAAGAAEIPKPLIDQLRTGARIVMPVGPGPFQEQLVVGTKRADGTLDRCTLGVSGFVPLTGRGARSPEARGLIDRTLPLCHSGPVT